MSDNYQPKIGDRVRVTHEGVIEKISRNGDLFRVSGGRTFTWFDGLHPEKVTVEKLADYNPEPEWVNGDVILVSDGEGTKTPLIYCAVGEFAPPHQPVWSCASCYQGWHLPASVSEDWRNGDVEILYKADQKKVA